MARRGRPTKAPPPGEKASLGLKVTASLKTQLEKAAADSGRTQSQEAEARLERSFDRLSLMPEVLELAYGRGAAGCIMMMAQAFSDAGTVAGRMRDPMGSDWTNDKWAFAQAMAAVQKVVEPYFTAEKHEEQPAPPPAAIEWKRKHDSDFPEVIAGGISRAVIGFAPADDRYNDFAGSVRPLLGINDVLVQMIRKKYDKTMGKKRVPK